MKKMVTKYLHNFLVLMLLFLVAFPALNVEAKQVSKSKTDEKVVVIDPSGQKSSTDKKEPVGPGAFKLVPESSANQVLGQSKTADYKINLEIANKLNDILTDAGYTVYMTRTSNDVDLSNSGRAMFANTTGADIFVVISADEEDTYAVCSSNDNPYNYGNYNQARLLSDAIIGSLSHKVECAKDGVIEDDSKAVINWSSAPTCIVAVGTADSEDNNDLADDEYQSTLAQGIADGIESYFVQK